MTTQDFDMFSLLFIDASVEAPQQLLAGLKSGIKAYVLDANQDGIQQITNIVNSLSFQERARERSIHIVAHEFLVAFG